MRTFSIFAKHFYFFQCCHLHNPGIGLRLFQLKIRALRLHSQAAVPFVSDFIQYGILFFTSTPQFQPVKLLQTDLSKHVIENNDYILFSPARSVFVFHKHRTCRAVTTFFVALRKIRFCYASQKVIIFKIIIFIFHSILQIVFLPRI